MFATRFQTLWQLFCWPMVYHYFQQYRRKAMKKARRRYLGLLIWA